MMHKFLCLLFAALVATSGTVTAEQTVQDLNGDAYKISDYLAEHLDVLNELNAEINDTEQTVQNDLTQITGVEKITAVKVFGETEKIAYLSDFDELQGYYLISDDYDLLDWKTDTASPFENLDNAEDVEEYYYSSYAGYMYKLYDDETVYSVNEENNATEEEIFSLETSQHYDGHEDDKAVGCGKIKDPDKYVKAKYGEGFSVSSYKSLEYICKKDQWDLSVYRENYWNSEGNCGLVASYNALQCLQQKGKLGNASSYRTTVTYKAQQTEPDIYKKYKYDGTPYTVVDSLTVPKLYKETRMTAVSKYGKVENFSIWQSARLIEAVAKNYGYTLDCDTYADWGSHVNTVIQKINENVPSLWSTSNDTYGSHTMCVTGYKIYTKTKKVLFLKFTTEKGFFELSDGHETEKRYYDIYGHIGLSAIVIIRGV